MQLSVIIPTKDRPVLLARALRSVLAQSLPAVEIIVADDGDGRGAAVARGLGEARVEAFSTGGLGQVQARTMAVARARGAGIAFLDDDDWWASPTHLAAMSAALRRGGLAYASGRIVREAAGQPDEELSFTAGIDRTSIRHNNLLLVSGIAYKRRLHAELGPFDDGLAVYWDWDWYLRLAAAGVTFVDCGERGVRISARPDTVSAPAQRAARQAELERLCAKHGLHGIGLKNHESIAVEQQAEAEAEAASTRRAPEREP